ncbi:cytochrome c oxidase subunit 5B, mitochondrial-like [Venturia canescens]|uniref:cytochrome c oxidase subunit 5B, mitochondrial-like n=1 Tax=Venturia canescens TaxID=32260 RepID=UPI001C9D20B5|nr:cytochrome c oxidase subunit 5B, mitochondrial-like [Venturia canescens]
MASLCRRMVFQAIRRPLHCSAVRVQRKTLPDPLELATGIEKRELLAIQAGNDDPFNLKTIKHGTGTKDDPNLVPSAFESRLIGCVCEEDATSITWMWLHSGCPRRCECGQWFKLIKKPPV